MRPLAKHLVPRKGSAATSGPVGPLANDWVLIVSLIHSPLVFGPAPANIEEPQLRTVGRFDTVDKVLFRKIAFRLPSALRVLCSVFGWEESDARPKPNPQQHCAHDLDKGCFE